MNMKLKLYVQKLVEGHKRRGLNRECRGYDRKTKITSRSEIE